MLVYSSLRTKYFFLFLSKMWKQWIQACLKFNRSIVRFFEIWARFITRNTISVIIVTLFTVLGLMTGFACFQVRHQTIRLHYPQNSPAFQDLDKTETSFNNYVKDVTFLITMSNKDKKMTSNVVRDEVFKYALQIHNEIINVSSVYNGKVITLRDICIMSNNRCLYDNVLELFEYKISKITNSGAVLKAAYLDKKRMLQSGRNFQMMMPELFGRYNANGDNITASAVRFMYRCQFGKTLQMYNRNRAIGKSLQDVFKKHKSVANGKGFQLYYDTERSIDDAVEENTDSNIVLMVITFTLMLIFCSLLTIGFRDTVGGHFYLGLVGIGCVLVGIGGGFGLVMLSGEPYVAFVGVLPFLVLAVGIDDMFIIMDKVDSLDPSITGTERLVTAIKHVGSSITMTSVTDIVAFIVTQKSDILSVRLFCIYAAVTVTVAYLLMMSLFVCFVVYDIKRIENGRRDIVPCMISPERITEPWMKIYKSEKVCSYLA